MLWVCPGFGGFEAFLTSTTVCTVPTAAEKAAKQRITFDHFEKMPLKNNDSDKGTSLQIEKRSSGSAGIQTGRVFQIEMNLLRLPERHSLENLEQPKSGKDVLGKTKR